MILKTRINACMPLALRAYHNPVLMMLWIIPFVLLLVGAISFIEHGNYGKAMLLAMASGLFVWMIWTTELYQSVKVEGDGTFLVEAVFVKGKFVFAGKTPQIEAIHYLYEPAGFEINEIHNMFLTLKGVGIILMTGFELRSVQRVSASLGLDLVQLELNETTVKHIEIKDSLKLMQFIPLLQLPSSLNK